MFEKLDKKPKPEHLKAGVSPIIPCVGMPKQLDQKEIERLRNLSAFLIDEQDKASENFIMCLGLVVCGIDKRTKRNISFMSHDLPYTLSKGTDDGFIAEKLCKMKNKCIEGTIDAVIVGGQYITGPFAADEHSREEYVNAVCSLAQLVEKHLGFEPVVITGPKSQRFVEEYRSSCDHVYFDTKNRRLYIVRDKVDDDRVESYMPSQIRQEERKW